MKCPKCGYTSFDYLDACRKCGGDLREARSLLQIIAVSPEQRGILAGTSTAAAAESPEAPSYGFGEPEASADFSAFAADSPEEGPGAELGHLNFDRSFADLVEPTSYREPSAPPSAPASEEDEGLLDIDFGDVFGDADSKKD